LDVRAAQPSGVAKSLASAKAFIQGGLSGLLCSYQFEGLVHDFLRSLPMPAKKERIEFEMKVMKARHLARQATLRGSPKGAGRKT